MPKPPKNIVASIKARLMNVSRAKGTPFDVTLIQYTLERILYRLSVSPHRNRFILKGGMLLTTWIDDDARFTRDLDLLGHGEASEDAIRGVFADLFAISAEDGLKFQTGDVAVTPIREEMEYGGFRLKTVAMLDRTRIPVTIDVGYGDVVTPAARDIDYPVLLDMPLPHIRSYPPETVVAEKFQAIVTLGMANTRMKDYYDLWILGKTTEFDVAALAQAIAATFLRRKTAVPAQPPVGLTREFATDDAKIRQWRAYLDSLGVGEIELQSAIDQIIALVMPAAVRAFQSSIR